MRKMYKNKIKKEGKVFTPSAIVVMILDSIKYDGKDMIEAAEYERRVVSVFETVQLHKCGGDCK